MSLPKFNDVPKHSIVIPSSGKKVTYRPFLVKEEKILLMALESEDQKQIARSVYDTVTSCVYEEIKPRELTVYDVEYLFLNIRSRAIGETATINLKCENCGHENGLKVNVTKVKVDNKKTDNMLDLGNKLVLEMQHPTFESMLDNEEVENAESLTDKVFAAVKTAIKAIHYNDERLEVKDYSAQEMNEFIDNLSGKQFAIIREYVEKIPKLTQDLEYDCEECHTHNKLTVEGLQNFL